MTTEAIIHIANKTSITICFIVMAILVYEIIRLIYDNNKS
jgi:hypothetical protein